MKKLNNKGISIIEILMCFVLVVSITVGLFTTLNNYKNKQELESYRNSIITYKNLLTKEIQDDLIKKVVKTATVNVQNENDHSAIYTVELTFKDNTKKLLKITKKLAMYENEDYINPELDQNDEFLIEYGPESDLIKYPLPNLGSTTNQNNYTVYDLKINNININTDNNILTIYIGLYHPEFNKRYAIDIVCPLNY